MWYSFTSGDRSCLLEAVRCNLSLVSDYLATGHSRQPFPNGPRPSPSDDLLALSRLSLVLADSLGDSSPVSLSSGDSFLLIGACRLRQAVLRDAVGMRPGDPLRSKLAARVAHLDRLVDILYDGGMTI